MLAPIVVIAFNRPQALNSTLESLAKNKLAKESELYLFIDGPREGKDGEKEKVEKVIEVARSATGFKSITIRESATNKGLAKSIIGAATELLNQYGRVIVVEDDLFLSPSFLVYMNQMLDYFEQDKRVFQVSGYSALINRKVDSDVYFNGRGQCWSWGTWKDRWEKIDWEIKDFYEFEANKKARKEWASFGNDLFGMLNSWKEGRLNSWWIRFSYNMFKLHCFTVCPIKSLVRNDGFGTESTHCNVFDGYKIEFDKSIHDSFYIPDSISWDKRLNRHATRYWSLYYRVYRKLMTIYYRKTGKLKMNK